MESSRMMARWLTVAASALFALAACRSSRAAAVSPLSVKLDAQRAIAVATAAVPGSAQEVRLESRKGKPAYEVMVLPSGANRRMRVEVDATTGQVTRSGAASRDDDDDDDD